MENLIPRGFAVLQHGDPKEGYMEKEFNWICYRTFSIWLYTKALSVFRPALFKRFKSVFTLLFLNFIFQLACQETSSSLSFCQHFFYSLDSILLASDKKENQIFLIYKEIQNGAVAKSYMGLLIYGEIFAHFLIYYEALPQIWLCNRFTLNFLFYVLTVFFRSSVSPFFLLALYSTYLSCWLSFPIFPPHSQGWWIL
jgi:hypothetical protein